jgi:hypothetical protein
VIAHTYRPPHAVSAVTDRALHLTTSYVRSVERYHDFVRAHAVPNAGLRELRVPEEERSLALAAEANGITVLGPLARSRAGPPRKGPVRQAACAGAPPACAQRCVSRPRLQGKFKP